MYFLLYIFLPFLYEPAMTTTKWPLVGWLKFFLIELNWISKRVAYKVLSLTSQYLRETAPRYLQEPVSPYTPPRGFSENTNKKHLWIQWEHKQKTPVDSVRTQTKIIQEQGSSAVLRPPYGTGCQTLHNTENVAFSAAAEILFVFDSYHLPASWSPSPDLFSHSTYCIPLLTVISLYCSPSLSLSLSLYPPPPHRPPA